MANTLLALGLAAALALGVPACGDEGTSGGGATTPVPPTSTPAATPAATGPAAQYAELCAGCHGDDGTGGRGPDLRGQDDVTRTAEQVREGGDRMPSFARDLTDEQIEALAEFVAREF